MNARLHYMAVARLHLRHALASRIDGARANARWHLAQASNARRFATWAQASDVDAAALCRHMTSLDQDCSLCGEDY